MFVAGSHVISDHVYIDSGDFRTPKCSCRLIISVLSALQVPITVKCAWEICCLLSLPGNKSVTFALDIWL